MDDQTWLAERFEQERSHLRAVAYRMLGSLTEADDALQETWLRLDRSDTDGVADLRAWLTTVVGRICLDMLRARRARREASTDGWLPEPIVRTGASEDPETQTVLADSVGLALIVVLETLTPTERLAFVLHDMFGIPFDEIGEMTGRTPTAARQLASRARRRVRGAATTPDADMKTQRAVVDAFLQASRSGDFDALVAVLDPEVVFRRHARTPLPTTAGAADVAREILSRGTQLAPYAGPATVNGTAGAVVTINGRPLAVVGFTVVGGRVAAIDVVTDAALFAEIEIG